MVYSKTSPKWQWLTADRARSIFRYDPDTGKFYWRMNRGSNKTKDQEAGWWLRGYLILQVGDMKFPAAHVAWIYMTGKLPPYEIDHKDGDPTNNKFDNLRLSTSQQNKWNRKTPVGESGLKGAYRSKRTTKPWRSQIKIDYKVKHLGRFDTALEAHQAYLRAAQELQHEFMKV